MALRIAIGNHKGGSGKTAATCNLAAALAALDRRVLVVDMDPQANLSRRLGARYDHDNPCLTTADVVKDAEEGVAAQAIRSTGWPSPYGDKVDIIPSRYDLENRIPEAGSIGAVLRLERAMMGVDDDYDFVLYDSPPSLGHLTQLALAASDYVLGITEPELDGIEGVLRLRDFVLSASHRKALSNPGLRIAGCLINRYRAISSHKFHLESLPVLFGAHGVWEPYIPERAVDKDASDAQTPLQMMGPQGREQAGLWTQHAKRLIEIGATS